MPVVCHFDICLYGFYIRSVYLKLFFAIFFNIVSCSRRRTCGVTCLVFFISSFAVVGFMLLLFAYHTLKYFCWITFWAVISLNLTSQNECFCKQYFIFSIKHMALIDRSWLFQFCKIFVFLFIIFCRLYVHKR